MNLELGKMKWQEGTLYLKPSGKFQFSPLYEFPEIVGDAEVDYACDMLNVNETIERFTKQKQPRITLSVGIGTYFKLLKMGWQVV